MRRVKRKTKEITIQICLYEQHCPSYNNKRGIHSCQSYLIGNKQTENVFFDQKEKYSNHLYLMNIG